MMPTIPITEYRNPPPPLDVVFADDPNSTALLVCEGHCNPAITKLDADVRATVKGRMGADQLNGGMEPLADAVLITRLHSLAYTLHEGRPGSSRFRCTACGHFRRFGGGLV